MNNTKYLHTLDIIYLSRFLLGGGSVCVDDGWLKQPHLAQSDWTMGLGEAARLLPIE